jgi:protein CpxP
MTRFVTTNMKRTAAMLLCSAALAMPALAQGGTTASGAQGQAQGPPPGGGMGGRRGGSPEQRLQMMQTELNLTPDQTTKVKAILEDGRTKMMALRDAGGTPEDNRPKMMALREAETAQIKAVLTDDQKPKFDAMEARQRDRMRGGGGNGAAPPPPPPPPPPPAAPQQ